MSPWSHHAIRYEAATKAATKDNIQYSPDAKEEAEVDHLVRDML
jgi:hypothetical protein